jgi:hypothetical protein
MKNLGLLIVLLMLTLTTIKLNNKVEEMIQTIQLIERYENATTLREAETAITQLNEIIENGK